MKLLWVPFRLLPRFYSSVPQFEASVPALLSDYRKTPFSIQDGYSEWKGNGGLLFLHKEDKLLGLLQLMRHRTFWELSSFVIHKDFQGMGYGRKMLNYGISNTDAPVCLRVQQENPAQELYRSVGFHTVSHTSGRYIMECMK